MNEECGQHKPDNAYKTGRKIKRMEGKKGSNNLYEKMAHNQIWHGFFPTTIVCIIFLVTFMCRL